MHKWEEIALRVRAGERLSSEDALILWQQAPLWRLAELAVERKEKISGN